MGAERRQFHRAEQPFEIHYRLAGELGQGWKTGLVVNISAGGMRFHGEEGVEAGRMLEIRIALPARRESLVLTGTVAWSHMKAAGVTEHGVAFHDMDPTQQAMIDDLVRFLMTSVRLPDA